MTVIQPIKADQNTAEIRFNGDDGDAPVIVRQLVVINPAGEPHGKIDQQLRRLGFELAYLAEDAGHVDDLDRFSDSASALVLDWRSDSPKSRDLAEMLAAKAAELGLPVLALAATDRAEDIRIASEAGLSTILSMPCRLADLKQTLDTLIWRARVQENTPELELNDAAALLESCKFRFRTPDDVDKLVPIIARLFPQPERSAAGLAELMLNAIEHGNLEIGHERKAEWIARGIYRKELTKRLQTPPYSNRWAELIVNRRDDGIMIVIMDEGCGFCWQDVVRSAERGGSDAAVGIAPCGEGLAKAQRESFDDLRFNHIGNQVTAFVSDDTHA